MAAAGIISQIAGPVVDKVLGGKDVQATLSPASTIMDLGKQLTEKRKEEERYREQVMLQKKKQQEEWKKFLMEQALARQGMGMTGFEMLANERSRAMQGQMGRQMGRDILRAMPTGGI